MLSNDLDEIKSSFKMTLENIAAYVQHEQNQGASNNALRRCRQFTAALYEWLPSDKTITKEQLLSWRQHLKDLGYSSVTELNYIKGINRYLDYIGCSNLRFNRGKPKDIAGMQFGYLKAIEPTGEKERKDYIWRCECKCGNEVKLPATRLLTENTLSCGCLRQEHLRVANKYYDGTSIRQSLEEKILSSRSSSGYTGVTKKGEKWNAYIIYKGVHYSLGSYSKLEDAIKARANGKQLVQMAAAGLLDLYEEIHRNDPEMPSRGQRKESQGETIEAPQDNQRSKVKRSDNTSGYPGVFQKRDKWVARITYQKVTYTLGSFADIDSAIFTRKHAENLLDTDPQLFLALYERRNKMGRIQTMRMERAKRAFKEEMFPSDKSRSFYVDHAGNAMGFTIERADGHVLSYNGENGHYEPFDIRPEDLAVNVPPYEYRDGKIVEAGAVNTKIDYLYRDADNYKVWNQCIIEGTLSEEQKQKILDSLFEGEWFIPHMVGLPEKQFEQWDEQSDHPFFELNEYSFEETALSPTVSVKAAELVAAFESCSKDNWLQGPLPKLSLENQMKAAQMKTCPSGTVGTYEVER